MPNAFSRSPIRHPRQSCKEKWIPRQSTTPRPTILPLSPAAQPNFTPNHPIRQKRALNNTIAFQTHSRRIYARARAKNTPCRENARAPAYIRVELRSAIHRGYARYFNGHLVLYTIRSARAGAHAGLRARARVHAVAGSLCARSLLRLSGRTVSYLVYFTGTRVARAEICPPVPGIN